MNCFTPSPELHVVPPPTIQQRAALQSQIDSQNHQPSVIVNDAQTSVLADERQVIAQDSVLAKEPEAPVVVNNAQTCEAQTPLVKLIERQPIFSPPEVVIVDKDWTPQQQIVFHPIRQRQYAPSDLS